MIKSYRARLVFYSIILMMFLSGLVTYSYLYIYDLVTSENEAHISRLSQSTVSSLTEERQELERYASLIANDLRLREYMFIVTNIGGEAAPLRELYERNFSSLPIDNVYIVDKNKKLLTSNNKSDSQYALKHYPANLGNNESRSFFLQDEHHFEFVATSEVHYRDHLLGYIAITRHINSQLLQKLRKVSGGHIFIVHHGEITISSLPNAVKQPFRVTDHHLYIDNDVYRVHPVNISDQFTQLPGIWLGLPETQLLDRLAEHRAAIFTVLGIGVVAILVIGLLLIRNFHQPLTGLMTLTREIGKGNFPALRKTQAQNEIDELSNHFVDMITALKDKQGEIERAHEALRQSAITDSLTGLHNRRYLQMIFPKLLAQANREQKYLGAIIVDIDHFKKINDTFGHLAGDICLASFADELRSTSRANDDLFRLGGEEFLILTISEDVAGIKAFAEKLRQSIEQGVVVYQSQAITLTVSAGISFASQHGSEQDILNQLLAQADEALYQAKHAGRNCVFTSPIIPHSKSVTGN
jgi:diguanylate cyclase (GGDEF)-like protein